MNNEVWYTSIYKSKQGKIYTWGVFLGILGGGMPPGSPSQDPIIFQTKKCKYSHPFSDLTSKKLCHHYFD